MDEQSAARDSKSTDSTLFSNDDEWKNEESTALVYPYVLNTGPIETIDSSMTAPDMFCHFFTDEVWTLL